MMPVWAPGTPPLDPADLWVQGPSPTYLPEGAAVGRGRWHSVGRVRLSETDLTGRIFTGAVIAWVASAEAEIVRDLGLSITPGDGVDLPTRTVTIDLVGPLAFGDGWTHAAGIDRIGRTSITFAHWLWRGDELAVQGTTVHVHVDAQGIPSAVPEVIVAASRSHGEPPSGAGPA